MTGGLALLERASAVFWDFDGVIKDSVDVKAGAFEALFLPFGKEVAERVRHHHEAHGGLSRFEKLPIYLEWVGEPATPDQVQDFCDRFSSLVFQAVIDAPWVPGVREYLLANHANKRFVLVTATPEEEIRRIVDALELSHCFQEIHGAPTPKAEAIGVVLKRWKLLATQAVVVGDSETDLEAATKNGVTLLLRKTPWNRRLQERYLGPRIEDLT